MGQFSYIDMKPLGHECVLFKKRNRVENISELGEDSRKAEAIVSRLHMPWAAPLSTPPRVFLRHHFALYPQLPQPSSHHVASSDVATPALHCSRPRRQRQQARCWFNLPLVRPLRARPNPLQPASHLHLTAGRRFPPKRYCKTPSIMDSTTHQAGLEGEWSQGEGYRRDMLYERPRYGSAAAKCCGGS